MRSVHLMILLGIAAFLTACASSNSGDVYSRSQTRQAQIVKMGTVESVRPVKIEGTRSPIGTAAGTVVGGVAGSSVGGGRGQAIATVIGAVAGGLVGAAAEEGLTRKDGLEITVQLDHGSLIAIVQELDETFSPGDRVRILEGGGVTRVSH